MVQPTKANDSVLKMQNRIALRKKMYWKWYLETAKTQVVYFFHIFFTIVAVTPFTFISYFFGIYCLLALQVAVPWIQHHNRS
jgi:hypothetical protein